MKTLTTSTTRPRLGGDHLALSPAEPAPAAKRRLWRRRPDRAATSQTEPMADPWTGGSQLLARAVSVLIALALLAGPAALLRSWLTPPPAPTVASTSLSPAMLARQSAARDVATQALTAYLTTPADRASTLATWWPSGSVTLPQVAPTLSSLEVLSVNATAPGVWTVTLAATLAPVPELLPAATPTPAAETSAAARRYYQLPMQVAGGAGDASATPITLPAPIPGPAVGGTIRQVYAVTTSVTGPAGASVQGFLAALLTGTGDLTRWVTPGTVIQAISPAPFTAVSVAEARADQTVDGLSTGVPADGARVHLVVSALVTDAHAQTQTVQYLLHLTARAGRWEVTSLDSAPATPLTPARSQ